VGRYHDKKTIYPADGGYIVAGHKGAAMWILQLDSDGNISWNKTYKPR